MRARRGWAAVLLAGAAGMAGLGPVLWVTALPAAASQAYVNIVDAPGPSGEGDYSPDVKPINVGDKVLWTNKTQTKHTVTSDPGSVSFDSGDLGPGGQFEDQPRIGTDVAADRRVHYGPSSRHTRSSRAGCKSPSTLPNSRASRGRFCRR